MNELPDPLTPPDCDLRDYPWMPLDVVRLRDSDLAGLPDAEAFRCAMLLFCAAWHQLPGASLPDDDVSLARLAGYGRDLKTFLKAKGNGAMRGWTKCSDGRLYHAVQAEKAREAMAAKAAMRARTEKARQSKLQKTAAVAEGNDTPPTAPVASSVTDNVTTLPTKRATEVATEPVASSVTSSVTGSRRQEKTGEEKKRKGSDLRSAPRASPGEGARDQLWTEGVPILRCLTGKPEARCRAQLGGLLKALGDDCASVLAVLHEAADLRPLDPSAWLVAAVETRAGARQTTLQARMAASDAKMREWIGDVEREDAEQTMVLQ